jgi:hypothetical protein
MEELQKENDELKKKECRIRRTFKEIYKWR